MSNMARLRPRWPQRGVPKAFVSVATSNDTEWSRVPSTKPSWKWELMQSSPNSNLFLPCFNPALKLRFGLGNLCEELEMTLIEPCYFQATRRPRAGVVTDSAASGCGRKSFFYSRSRSHRCRGWTVPNFPSHPPFERPNPLSSTAVCQTRPRREILRRDHKIMPRGPRAGRAHRLRR